MAPTWKSSSGEEPTGAETTHASDAVITATMRMITVPIRRDCGRVGTPCAGVAGESWVSDMRGVSSLYSSLRCGRRRGKPRCEPKQREPT